METPLEKLDARMFREQLHTGFRVQLGDATVALELASVEERESSPRVELFLLVFNGPLAPRLPQRIFLLEHEKLGTFSIFLTAIAGDAEGISYEAVFNRLRKKSSS